jgi:hypothetical protein
MADDINVSLVEEQYSVTITEESYTVQLDGASGADGREIELQTNATHIQWRYVGDVAWTNLVALADITGSTGATGERGITPRGAYDSLTAYVVDDLVTHNGNAYICVQNSTGNNPSNATYWLLYVAKGDVGATGSQGDSATVAVGTVTTLAAGSPATVTNVGTGNDAVLDFGIPEGDKGDKGDTGDAATIAVGTVTSVPNGDPATVTNVGTSGAAIFDFEIPTGAQGIQGVAGTAATVAVGNVTTLAAGTPATVSNTGTSSAAVFDFGIPQGVKGDKGDQGDPGVDGADGVSPTIAAGTNISVVESPVGTFTINNTQDISGKLDANTPITGATKTKITYDADGLVTAGADATTADIVDSFDKRYVTDAQLTVLGNTSGTNSGDQNIFSTIAVSGQGNVVADSTSDTLTLAAGTNITITTDQSTDTITINSAASSDNSYKKSFLFMGA